MMSRRSQRGSTLISTLIGVVLSLLTIGAMMLLHRTMVEVSSQSSQELSRDGQVQSSLQNALTDLQQAGFGILPGEAGQNLWTSEDGKRVSWRYRADLADTGFVCGGLWIADQQGDRSEQDMGLLLFRDFPCESADDNALWQSSSPYKQQLASHRSFHETEGGETLAYGLSRAVFVKENVNSCLPFHSEEQTKKEHPRVSLVIDGRTTFQSCLVNLLP